MAAQARGSLKVCDIVQAWGPKSGGVKRYVRGKMDYAGSCPFLEHVLIVPGGQDARRWEQRSLVYEIESFPIVGTQGYRLLLNRDRMLEIIDREAPDVLEVGNAYRPAWVAVEAGQRERIPVVAFYHSDFPRALGEKLKEIVGLSLGEPFTRAVEHYLAELYNQMDAVLVATVDFQKRLHTMGVERVVRIPLGTDTNLFYPRDSRSRVLEELGLPEETRLLLFVGRFADMKNLPVLLASLDELPPEGGPYHLVLVGDGEKRAMVGRAASERSDVTWYPYVEDHDKLAALYSAADLFVNPGTRETFGLVSVEAQACCTPVLGVRRGGMDETLQEGEIMAEEATPSALAEAAGRILARKETEEVRVARRRWVENHFSLKRTFDRLFSFYGDLGKGKPLAPWLDEEG